MHHRPARQRTLIAAVAATLLAVAPWHGWAAVTDLPPRDARVDRWLRTYCESPADSAPSALLGPSDTQAVGTLISAATNGLGSDAVAALKARLSTQYDQIHAALPTDVAYGMDPSVLSALRNESRQAFVERSSADAVLAYRLRGVWGLAAVHSPPALAALAAITADPSMPADIRAAATEASARLAADVDDDGRISCADLGRIKLAFGAKVNQRGFDARADVNRDGVVDVRDLAAVSRLLPAGTRCP